MTPLEGVYVFNSRNACSVRLSAYLSACRAVCLVGSVTWSTWGSKLESIFTPIFATLPTLQGIQVYTHINSPLDIYLSQGLSKENASKWRDTMVYVIMGELLWLRMEGGTVVVFDS